MPGQNHFMRMAIELATANVHTRCGGPFGAVIVRAGVVVATGANQVTATNDPTAHAEVTAIRNAAKALASFDLSGCEIYSSCEPCPMCLSAILWARLDALFYANTAEDAAEAGFDDSFFYAQVRLPAPERELPSTNLLRAEALASFAAWRECVNRVDY